MGAERYTVQVPDVEYYQKNINCQYACPAKTDARGYVNAIAEGDYQQAYVMAREPNPFASTCGRICPAYCEQACRRSTIDEPIAIRALKRFVTEKFGVEQRLHTAPSLESAPGNSHTSGSAAALARSRAQGQRQGRVAIIGSGPSGLTAAHDLALLSYHVTIFEALPYPGGKERIAIPHYRVPQEVVDGEIEAITSLGVELRLEAALGRDFTLGKLKEQGFGAVYLALGSDASRKLSRPEEGIFGEGDVAYGNVAVIDAVAAGHAAARQVDEYMLGQRAEKAIQACWEVVEPRQELHPDYLFIERHSPPLSHFMGDGQKEMEQPYSEAEARLQAQRCLRCHIQTVFDGDKCILCGGCVDVCPKNCYKMVGLDQLQGDEQLKAVVAARYGLSLEEFHRAGEAGNQEILQQGTAIIKDETACIRCGLCARRCPVGAITMEAFYFVEEVIYNPQPAAPTTAGGRV